MNIDITATILQVSPASAARAEVAGPQQGAGPAIGFAQLLAAVLCAEEPIQASTLPGTPASDPAKHESPGDPAASTTSFDAIFALLGTQPPAPTLQQAPLPENHGPQPAAPQPELSRANIVTPGASAGPQGTSALNANLLPVVAGAEPQPSTATPSKQGHGESTRPLTPKISSTTLPLGGESALGGGKAEAKGSTAIPVQSMAPPEVPAAQQPDDAAAQDGQALAPNPALSGAAKAHSGGIFERSTVIDLPGAKNLSDQTQVEGSATAQLHVPATDFPVLPHPAAGSSPLATGFTKASDWRVFQPHLVPFKPAALETISAAIARKVSRVTERFSQLVAQQSLQTGDSVTVGATSSSPQGDQPVVGNSESNAANLTGADPGTSKDKMQNSADIVLQLPHAMTSTAPQRHHDRTTLPELPHRIADIVTSRLEKHSSADQGSVVLRLDPPELGRVTVHVSMANDVVSVRLVASEDGARQVLETHLGDLQQSLTDQGVALNNCQVESYSAGGHSSGGHHGWPLPGESDLVPAASKQTPVVASPGRHMASRAALDYVA